MQAAGGRSPHNQLQASCAGGVYPRRFAMTSARRRGCRKGAQDANSTTYGLTPRVRFFCVRLAVSVSAHCH